MEGQNVEESKTTEAPVQIKSGKWKKKIILIALGLLAAAAVVLVVVKYLVPGMANVEWTSPKMIAAYIAAGLVVAVIVSCLVLRKTVRTRLRMEREIREDPDINDWLVIFNWSTKVLYVPTIIASLLAAVIMYLQEAHLWIFDSIPPVVIGGIWLAIFFLNFLIEEFSISIKVLLIGVVSIGFLLLWLHLCGWVVAQVDQCCYIGF